MNMNKKAKAEEIAIAMRAHAVKYGFPLKKIVQNNDCQEEALDLNLSKPAKQFDIIEVTEGPYINECKVGERFVALEVLRGDHTVISMKSDGKRVILCYPEEYVVVSNVEEFKRDWKRSSIPIGEVGEIEYAVKPRKEWVCPEN
ncbi:hypothetical protein [Sporosarcina sp. FSL W7-1283]|uniref:hypothetical protein n=1 Tax=Sporosarcina sp. FSL W7-1283 TaxID=2921560 RepID=UPI0030FB351D